MAREKLVYRTYLARDGRKRIRVSVTLEPVGPDFIQLRVRTLPTNGSKLAPAILTAAIPVGVL